MSKQRERIVWLDAYTLDDWMYIEDIEMDFCKVETLGYCVRETSEILCIAQNTEGSMYGGLLFIPKINIISREDIIVKKKKKKRKKK